MFKEIIAVIAPPAENASPRKIFYWRLTCSGFMMVLLLFITFSFGGIWQLDGFALAGDVDMKITEAVRPITASVKALKITVESQGAQLRTSLQFDYAEKIRDAAQAKCETNSSAEQRRISDTIERLQVAYHSVTKSKDNPDGERYPIPICN